MTFGLGAGDEAKDEWGHEAMSETGQLERHEPGLRVFAEWTRSSEGPQRLVIEAPVVNEAALRRSARHLADMAAEHGGLPAVGARQVMIRRYAEDQLALLPGSGDAYHRGLLDIRDDLGARGVENTDQVLASAMRVPVETLLACVRVAEQRLGR